MVHSMVDIDSFLSLFENGVESLTEGQFEEAISFFRRAAQQCLEMSQGPVTVPLQCSPYDREFRACDFRALSLEAIDRDWIESISPNNSFDVLRTIFVLPIRNCRNWSQLTVVILYNLAFSHHMQALLNRQKSNFHFCEAERLYKLTMSTLKVQHDVFVSRNLIIILCLLVNVGHLFSHHGRMHETIICLSMLEGILDSPDADTSSLTTEQRGLFYLITLTARLRSTVAPAA